MSKTKGRGAAPAAPYAPLAVPAHAEGYTVHVHHDADPRAPADITAYVHCVQCLRDKPAGVSPQEWARLEAGITSTGMLQVRCARHNVNVVLFHAVAARRGGH